MHNGMRGSAMHNGIFRAFSIIPRDEWIKGGLSVFRVEGSVNRHPVALLVYGHTGELLSKESAADYDAYKAAIPDLAYENVVCPGFTYSQVEIRDMTAQLWIVDQWQVKTENGRTYYDRSGPREAHGAAARQRNYELWITSGDRARGAILVGNTADTYHVSYVPTLEGEQRELEDRNLSA